MLGSRCAATPKRCYARSSHLHACREPLSEAEWQAYLPQHALYAQRRYRYHARMVAIGYKQFLPSLTAYQRLTNRNPDPYTAFAISLLQQLIAEYPAHVPVELWELITGEADDDTASEDLSSLPDICGDIQSGVGILQMQNKTFVSDVARRLGRMAPQADRFDRGDGGARAVWPVNPAAVAGRCPAGALP